MNKYKIGETVFYMYMNFICKSKVKSFYEKDGQVIYSDGQNTELLEKFLFKTKEELFDFHSGRIKKKK